MPVGGVKTLWRRLFPACSVCRSLAGVSTRWPSPGEAPPPPPLRVTMASNTFVCCFNWSCHTMSLVVQTEQQIDVPGGIRKRPTHTERTSTLWAGLVSGQDYSTANSHSRCQAVAASLWHQSISFSIRGKFLLNNTTTKKPCGLLTHIQILIECSFQVLVFWDCSYLSFLCTIFERKKINIHQRGEVFSYCGAWGQNEHLAGDKIG